MGRIVLANLVAALFGCRFHKHDKPLDTAIYVLQLQWVTIGRCCRCGLFVVAGSLYTRMDDATECLRCGMRATHSFYAQQLQSMIEFHAQQVQSLTQRANRQGERLQRYERFASTMRDIADREIQRQQAAQL